MSLPVGRTQLDPGRAAASAVLLSAYITSPPERVGNHGACFEYWVLAAAYMLRLAEQHRSREDIWSLSFELCEFQLIEQLKDCRPNVNLGRTLSKVEIPCSMDTLTRRE